MNVLFSKKPLQHRLHLRQPTAFLPFKGRHPNDIKEKLWTVNRHCAYCGDAIAKPHDGSLEHLRTAYLRGPRSIENLVFTHLPCNNTRHHLLPADKPFILFLSQQKDTLRPFSNYLIRLVSRPFYPVYPGLFKQPQLHWFIQGWRNMIFPSMHWPRRGVYNDPLFVQAFQADFYQRSFPLLQLLYQVNPFWGHARFQEFIRTQYQVADSPKDNGLRRQFEGAMLLRLSQEIEKPSAATAL